MNESTNELWECVVVGGGAAGLSAALTLGRARRTTLLIDAGEQSNRVSPGIGGLLGHDHRPPAEFYESARGELAKYPTIQMRSGRVAGGTRSDRGFELVLEDGKRVRARRVLLALGMDYLPPPVAGVAERWGRSVFHCPFCHGWEVRESRLGVLDAGASGVDRALLLRFWSDDVTLYTDGATVSSEADLDRLQRAGVDVDPRPVRELTGAGDALEEVVFVDGSSRACEGMLVPAPMHQRTDLAVQLGADLAEPDAPAQVILVDDLCRTSVEGLYAAGDVAADGLPSVAASIAAGSVAAKAIVRDLVTLGA